MPATEPIEISFALNSTELNQEFKRIITGSKDSDEAVGKLKEKFKQLNAAQVLGVDGAKDMAGAMEKVNNQAKSTKLDEFGVKKENIKIQKKVILELEQQLKELDKQIKGMAPGKDQLKVMGEAGKVKTELAAEKKALKDLEVAVGQNEETHRGFSAELLHVKDEMASLVAQGKENSTEFRTLKNRSVELQKALDRVRSQTKNLSRQGIQGMVQGLSAMAGGFSAVQGATALFAGENENLQKIMVKVQSLMAITIGLQQISEALDKRSAFSTKFLAKAKTTLTRVNTRLATALGITNAQATALMATLTLGLSAAVTGIIVLMKKWRSGSAAVGEAQKKMAEGLADDLAEPIFAYKKLQKQWENLAGDLKSKKRFIDENHDAFHKLGVSVGSVNDADRIFVDNTEAFIKMLKLRAEATARAQVAQDIYKKAIEEQMEAESQFSSHPSFTQNLGQIWNIGVLGKSRKEYKNEVQKDADKRFDIDTRVAERYLEQSEALQERVQKIRQNLNLKDPDDDGKPEDDFLPPGSVAAIKDRIKEIDDALNKTTDQAEVDQLKDKRIKAAEELAEAEKRIEIQSVEEAISEREKKWKQYYALSAEIGQQTANKQFAGLKEEAGSFYEWLEKQKTGYIDLTADGEVLTDKQKNDLERFAEKLNELKGQKIGLDKLKADIKAALEETPVLVEQLDLLQKKIEKFGDDPKNLDNGFLNFLTGKKADVEKELDELSDSFLKEHRTLEQEKTQISEKYAAIRRSLDRRSDIGPGEKQRLKQEASAEEEMKIEEAERGEAERLNVFQRYSQNIMAIGKRELKVRLQSLEEYVAAAKNALTTEEKDYLATQIKKTKAVLESGGKEKQLLAEKLRLQKKIAREGKDGFVNPRDIKTLEKINKELGDMAAKKLQKTASLAGAAGNGFREMARAIGDSNEGLSDTLETMADVLGVVEDAATAATGFASGNIAAGISGTISAVAGVFSIGKKARESERKAQKEMQERLEDIFRAGMDYNKMLRNRLQTELEINEAHKTRIQALKDEMKINDENMEGVLDDLDRYLRKMLKADVTVGEHTEKYGGFLGIGRKTRVVKEQKTVAEMLGLPTDGNWNRTMQRELEKMFGDLDQGETWDDILDKMEEINSQHPFEDDAKDLFEAMEQLKEEYGNLEIAQKKAKQEIIDTYAGQTSDSIAEAIVEGLKQGKRSFADFGDDFEKTMQNAMVNAFLNNEIIKRSVDSFQEEIADAMKDGQLTDEELDNLRDQYKNIIGGSGVIFDQLFGEGGLNLFDDAAGKVNSLQGAYKAASQESIDLLSGNTAGLRLAVLEGNATTKNGFAGMLEQMSRAVQVQLDIEKNTRRTADNTERLRDIDSGVDKLNDTMGKGYKAMKGNGL